MLPADETRLAIEKAVHAAYDSILNRVKPLEFGEWQDLKNDLEKLAEPGTELRRKIEQRFRRNDGDNYTPFELLNDWRQILQFFTNHQQDYADALFHHFGLAQNERWPPLPDIFGQAFILPEHLYVQFR